MPYHKFEFAFKNDECVARLGIVKCVKKLVRASRIHVAGRSNVYLRELNICGKCILRYVARRCVFVSVFW